MNQRNERNIPAFKNTNKITKFIPSQRLDLEQPKVKSWSCL